MSTCIMPCAATQDGASTLLPREVGLDVVVSGTTSDAHTWNLVFLQLLLEELGHRVTGLGPNIPAAELVEYCADHRPHLIVVSSVNGHGFQDGLGLIHAIRVQADLRSLPVVIGGKLGTSGSLDGDQVSTLLSAGYNAVMQDSDDGMSLSSFQDFLAAVGPERRAVVGSGQR